MFLLSLFQLHFIIIIVYANLLSKFQTFRNTLSDEFLVDFKHIQDAEYQQFLNIRDQIYIEFLNFANMTGSYNGNVADADITSFPYKEFHTCNEYKELLKLYKKYRKSTGKTLESKGKSIFDKIIKIKNSIFTSDQKNIKEATETLKVVDYIKKSYYNRIMRRFRGMERNLGLYYGLLKTFDFNAPPAAIKKLFFELDQYVRAEFFSLQKSALDLDFSSQDYNIILQRGNFILEGFKELKKYFELKKDLIKKKVIKGEDCYICSAELECKEQDDGCFAIVRDLSCGHNNCHVEW
jgi:hypothetical protein